MEYLHKFQCFFHNGSNCNYHFIIKQVTEKFEKLTCLGKILKNTFSVPLQKEVTKIDKIGEEIS